MSCGLAPSKSTVYVSNLPFSLTNNDLHKVFEKYGKVVKVTIVKDKTTHRSKGVAFILFLDRDSAYNAVRSLNNTQMFNRTLKCSIAKDNGRAPEFIRRRVYKDKSRCYECGEPGHLSYKCPKNLLGEREPPPKKKRKSGDLDDWDDSDAEEGPAEQKGEDSWAATLSFQRQMGDDQQRTSWGTYKGESSGTIGQKKKKYKKDAYFSDEEEEVDAD